MTTCISCDGQIGPSMVGGGRLCDCPEPTAEQIEAQRRFEEEWRAAHPDHDAHVKEFTERLRAARARQRELFCAALMEDLP